MSVNDYEKSLMDDIIRLKEEKGITIFAHNYQRFNIQKVADLIGDSLFLAKKIKDMGSNSKILYATVKFMAETGAVLNEDAEIYFPQQEALCPMALQCTPEILKNYKKENPDVPIVLYINSTTESKQFADVICTSSNAVEICKKIQKEYGSDKIGFGPDKNLGSHVANMTGIKVDILPPNGNCYVHNEFSISDVDLYKKNYPNSKILFHPEAPKEVLNYADYIGSTAGMYDYIVEHPDEEMGIGTEIGLLDRIKIEHPLINVHPIKDSAICHAMKKYTLEIVKWGLEEIDKSIKPFNVDPNIAEKAKIPIVKMFELMEN